MKVYLRPSNQGGNPCRLEVIDDTTTYQAYRASVDLWDNAESTPEAAPNLWAQIILQGEHRIIPDVITAELALAKGEIGIWKGKNYRAKRDGVVHNPDVYPNDWEEV